MRNSDQPQRTQAGADAFVGEVPGVHSVHIGPNALTWRAGSLPRAADARRDRTGCLAEEPRSVAAIQFRRLSDTFHATGKRPAHQYRTHFNLES